LALNEKEILFRELDHRVKNNLQIISSLLSLQGGQLRDPSSRELFKECQHRVRAIALVHQRLCGGTNLANIDLGAYFRQLVQELLRSYYSGQGKITPNVVVDQTVISIEHLIPCALIVNELVCNAFKYAFPAGKSGEVRVEVRRNDGLVSLTVADDGVGFSPGEAQGRSGVGLQIVQSLVEQLSGRLQWTNGHGTSATITFPQTK
jgi:two-component sensor histidine kinase